MMAKLFFASLGYARFIFPAYKFPLLVQGNGEE